MQVTQPVIIPATKTKTKPRVVREQQEKNKRFANDGSYESVERMLIKLSMRCFARIEALGGLGMTFEDVRQEMNLNYVLARAKWSPEGGARFATYCQTACQNNFNGYIEKRIKERTNLGMVNFTDLGHHKSVETGDEFDPLEFIDDQEGGSAKPEDLLDKRQQIRDRLFSMSAGARRLVNALLQHETNSNNIAPPKMRELARDVGLTGDELRQVKLEVLSTFGVQWA